MAKNSKLDFSTKKKTAETLDILQLCANLLKHNNVMTELSRETAAEAIEDYIRIKQRHGEIGSKNRKWKSIKQKNAYNNLKRRTELSEEEILEKIKNIE